MQMLHVLKSTKKPGATCMTGAVQANNAQLNPPPETAAPSEAHLRAQAAESRLSQQVQQARQAQPPISKPQQAQQAQQAAAKPAQPAPVEVTTLPYTTADCAVHHHLLLVALLFATIIIQRQ